MITTEKKLRNRKAFRERRRAEDVAVACQPIDDAMAPEIKYALLESAAGYALFERKEGDEVSSKLTHMQQLVVDTQRFMRCAAAH